MCAPRHLGHALDPPLPTGRLATAHESGLSPVALLLLGFTGPSALRWMSAPFTRPLRHGRRAMPCRRGGHGRRDSTRRSRCSSARSHAMHGTLRRGASRLRRPCGRGRWATRGRARHGTRGSTTRPLRVRHQHVRHDRARRQPWRRSWRLLFRRRRGRHRRPRPAATSKHLAAPSPRGAGSGRRVQVAQQR